jgi:hypothetical protein
MPSLDDVYCKFGLTAEAAQLLETELGTLLKAHRLVDAGLFESFDLMRAGTIFQSVNRHTLGQLLKSLNSRTQSLDTLTDLLAAALKARNRLSHSFFREHNFRRNSEEGRATMLQDLEGIHSALLDAYKAIVLLLQDIDLEQLKNTKLPTVHLPN